MVWLDDEISAPYIYTVHLDNEIWHLVENMV